MKRIASLALQGLAAVLPVALTLYLVFWLLTSMETVARKALLALLPENMYFQGLGLLSVFLFLVLAGILVQAYVVRYLIDLGEDLLARIPLIKPVFGAIQDFMRMFSPGGKQEAESVVLVELPEGLRLIGFVTGRDIAQRLIPDAGEDIVGVYLPMSYMIGGYTIYVESSRLRRLDISVEEGMRIALTGGIRHQGHTARPGREGPGQAGPGLARYWGQGLTRLRRSGAPAHR